jgi:hypothetical protein
LTEGRGTTNANARPPWRSRWWLPVWSAGLGVAMLIAAALGGDALGGLIIAASFFVVAGGLVIAERSESLRGVGGPAGDERFARIEVGSMATAGRAMGLAVIVAWIIALANGDEGASFTWVLGIGAIAYVISLAWRRARY